MQTQVEFNHHCYFTNFSKVSHLNFKIYFRHLVMLEMIPFEKMFWNSRRGLQYDWSNLGVKFCPLATQTSGGPRILIDWRKPLWELLEVPLTKIRFAYTCTRAVMRMLCSLVPRLSLPVVGEHKVLVRTCELVIGDALNICTDGRQTR